ncbi:TetR/AcrR family transcriptional regulator [Mucilaginibacter sp. R-33]|uniref:TetR/AcrR family transcriptional regulator n=1 Tax=Mucilaginibacter sp. R-33 TaxID=3416711 RepID=UPI003CEEBA57
MATKKKRHKIRDPDQTKRRLIDAIGEILQNTGYTGLRVNAIARYLGRDKNLVRYYFDSLANLQKAYIMEKDYWPPFFERFQLGKDADKDRVKTLFMELMQENYRFFNANKEMQKIILWQISEENPLMRSISEAREREGDKLLGLTEPFFRNSGISFKAVIALLLGGIYYIVLHANTNRSKVCGIDINLEKDSEALKATIAQVISWAFAAAEKGNEN